MSESIRKIIDELHLYEKQLLDELGKNEDSSPEEISKNQGLDIKSVMSASGSLTSKKIIKVKKTVSETVKLSKDGLKFAKDNLPERKVLKALVDKEKIPMGNLAQESGIDKKETNIAVGWLVRKKWAKIDKGTVFITDFGKESLNTLGSDEKLLNLLKEKEVIIKDDLDKDLLDGFKKLKDRKNILKTKKNITHSFKLLDKGKDILRHGFEIKKQATQLTHKQLKEGLWKDLEYRPYDINAEAPEFFPGKGHPLRRIIEEIREIFLNLGFSEDNGSIVDSAFWNFDSLFQPQDHAAREMQDTFYLKNPLKCDLPNEDLVKKIAEVHNDGADTGSIGWQYDWDEDIARQSVLRTHTTGISTKCLFNNEVPIKMFSVGRVFRRETITYKHLPEFHQVEGIIAGENIDYSNLLGILKEFYKKLGFEARFRPAYFPYTYLSTECEVYLEDKESWIELGGSGMLRPEVLAPLGIDVPVLAFGIGIERLAMIRYDISDIRMLYKSDISWLRDLPIRNGIKLSD